MVLLWVHQAALFAAAISALSIPFEALRVGLLPRADDVCGGGTGFSQCGGNFPTNFCCQTGSTCFGFNNNQSVICCPNNECPFINTLSCDPALYNATTFPTSPIHMSDLSQNAYISCGTTGKCCPKGYSCNNGGCTLDVISSAPSSSSATLGSSQTTSGSAPTSIKTAPTLVSVTNGPAPSSTSATPSISSTSAIGADAASVTGIPSGTPSKPQFPVEAIMIGLFPGLAAGCLIAFLVICCLGRRKARKLASQSSDSLGPTAAKISDPIYATSPVATRTDFLRYTSRRIAKKASKPLMGTPGGESSISRVKSLFHKTPSSSSMRGRDNNHWGRTPQSNRTLHDNPMPDPSAAAERALNEKLHRNDTISTLASDGPRTPRRGRQPSTESIFIANCTPDAGGYRRDTTFGDLLPSMNQRGVPKMPSPPSRNGNAGLRAPISLGSPPTSRRLV